MKKVLLIEDDSNLAFMITDGLESEGFSVFHMTNGEEMMAEMDNFIMHTPDIILLDVNLKGAMNGFELSKKIRKHSQIPIIFTTSRTQIQDIQEGYKIGNVDYLKKPYGIRELVLRINELLSRYPVIRGNEKLFYLGSFVFSPASQCLQRADEMNHLQKNECAVLKILCENLGKVVTKTTILESVWEDEDLKQKEASLHNILSFLRGKLKTDKTVKLESIPKMGWKLTVVG